MGATVSEGVDMKEYFSEAKEIKFEGQDSENPLAFKHYDADEQVAGKMQARLQQAHPCPVRLCPVRLWHETGCP